MKSHQASGQSASDLIAALEKKEISAIELLEQAITRIESFDNKINAMPIRDFERARKSAKEADAAISRGEKKPLLGLPISVKESFNITQLPTTWGNPQFKEWYPSEDSLVISRLKKAGAIIIGKTNVPFMLRDWQTYNDIYGTTNNPWNLQLTPGGSSGGSAATIAAGYVSLELGSDVAGSLRVPANYCGVFAHKPTQDIVPLRGSSPPTVTPLPIGSDLVTLGPIARTAKDLKLALDILAGPDELLNGKGYQLKLPSPRYSKLKDYKVLALDSHPLCPTASVIQGAISQLVDKLSKLGVSTSYNVEAIPDLAKITQVYSILLSAVHGVSISLEAYESFKIHAKELLADDTRLMAYRTRGYTCSYRDWFIINRKREELRKEWRELFKPYDVVICPVMPTTAFAHDHTPDIETRKIIIDGKLTPYYDQIIWVSIATVFGLPATVMPISYSAEGLPIGIQIIGDYLEDLTTLKFAELLEYELDNFQMPNL